MRLNGADDHLIVSVVVLPPNTDWAYPVKDALRLPSEA